MSRCFADTAYWIAFVDRRDPYWPIVQRLRPRLTDHTIVTTQVVFLELLTFFSGQGSHLRSRAVATVRGATLADDVDVVPTSEDQFLAGLALYEARPDKGYSLVDCISMTVMRDLDITAALTSDRHFEQEGFEVLLK